VEVSHKLQEVRFLLHQDGLVPVLDEMAHPAMAPVECPGIPCEERSHGGHQAWLDGLPWPGMRATDKEVEVVRQQYPREDLESRTFHHPCKPSEEFGTIPVVAEEHLPVQSADHDVMQHSRRIQARSSWHVKDLSSTDLPMSTESIKCILRPLFVPFPSLFRFAVQRWLARQPRFQLHFIPTSSSWLNLIERWFRELTTKRLRRGVFKGVPDLIAAIEEFVAHHNRHPRSFTRTAKVEDFLAKVERARTVLHKMASV
jgi:hypothetical protein